LPALPCPFLRGSVVEPREFGVGWNVRTGELPADRARLAMRQVFRIPLSRNSFWRRVSTLSVVSHNALVFKRYTFTGSAPGRKLIYFDRSAKVLKS
jgi:hypothetical protein